MKWVLCVQWLRLAVTGLGLGLQSLHSLCQLHTNGLLKLIEGPFGLHSLHSYTIGLSRPIRWVKIASNSILQFRLRSEKHIPNLLPKVITHIEGWHKRFFYVRDSIIPASTTALTEAKQLDFESFKDKLPSNIKENPMFQRLSRYPKSVRVFPDPILFLVGLKPSWEHGQQRPAIMAGRKVNTKPPKDVEEPEVQPAEVTADLGESPKADVFIVHPGSVVVRIKERKCKTRGGSLRPPVKRRLASGSLSSYVMCAKTSASKDDALFLSISDDDEGKFLVIEKMSGEADVIKARERSSKECERLRFKCYKVTLSTLESKVNSLEADKASDELDRLVGKLVSSAITYGRCRAYKQVAAMKEPFDLSKAKGYHSSYQKDHT
ncbi:hypothetical protein Tco_0256642 [Tanacetum coccineum]